MLGLCLAGGGARGAYQIGVCMALKEAGLLDQVSYFSGTSIGAANATMLACTSVEKLRDVWFNLPDDVLHKSEKFFKRVIHENIKFLKNGIYDLTELRKIVKENIDFNILKEKRVFVTLSDCGVEEGGITSLIKSSYLHYIKKNRQVVYAKLWEQSRSEMIQHVLASCSIPLVFPAAKIKGEQYYDGGLYDNVPVKPLVDAGCDEIIVIHLDWFPYNYVKKYPDVRFHSIKSSRLLGLKLNFNPEQSKIRFQYGYEDGVKYLQKKNFIEKKN